jgi:hypothetical protein
MQQAEVVVVVDQEPIGEAQAALRCAEAIIPQQVELVVLVVEHYRATIELDITKPTATLV